MLSTSRICGNHSVWTSDSCDYSVQRLSKDKDECLEEEKNMLIIYLFSTLLSSLSKFYPIYLGSALWVLHQTLFATTFPITPDFITAFCHCIYAFAFEKKLICKNKCIWVYWFDLGKKSLNNVLCLYWFFPLFFSFDSGKKSKTPIIIGIVISLAFLVAGLVLFTMYRLNRSRRTVIEAPKVVAKSLSAKDIASLQNQYLKKESIEGLNRFLTHLWRLYVSFIGLIYIIS